MKKIFFAAFFILLGFIVFLPYIGHTVDKKSAKTNHKNTAVQTKLVKAATIAPTDAPAKNEFTIAVYGDSMVDTMGEGVDYLKASLEKKYPQIVFHLYNYGIGGENVQQGLDRFNSPFKYQLRNQPALPDIHPDIVIMGSFSYNPFNPYDRNKHWITLSQLIEKTKKITRHPFILAEIAPLGKNFGKGPHGVNWPEEMTLVQSREITEQLENAVALGTALNVPVINVYAVTKSGTTTGASIYTNSDDGIHPSIEGHTFMAKLITEAIHSVLVATPTAKTQ